MTAFHVSDPFELLRIGSFFMVFRLEEFLLLSFAAAAVLSLVVRTREARGRMFLMLSPWMVVALFWFVNPHNNLTNGRFLFPAFLLFGYCVAVVVDDARDIPGKVFLWLAPAALIGSSVMAERDHLILLLRDVAGLAWGGGNRMLEGAKGPRWPCLRFARQSQRCLHSDGVRQPIAGFGFRHVVAVVLCAATAFGFTWMSAARLDRKYAWYKSFPAGQAWARWTNDSGAVPEHSLSRQRALLRPVRIQPAAQRHVSEHRRAPGLAVPRLLREAKKQGRAPVKGRAPAVAPRARHLRGMGGQSAPRPR